MRAMLVDLDGTMYRGSAIIPQAKAFYERCLKEGIPVYFFTNNASRTPKINVEHMLAMGYDNIKPEQFYNSAMAAVLYVKKHYAQRSCWMIGSEGLRQALLEQGFVITDQNPAFVFIGMDQSATYWIYSKALQLLLDGAQLIGTNSDRILANPNGFDVGNGAIVHMLEYASGQKSPKLGKPHADFLDLFLEKEGLKKDEVVIVGDNLETDIALGYNNQVKTIFVTSGVHHKEDIERFAIYPDLVVETLDEMDPVKMLEIIENS